MSLIYDAIQFEPQFNLPAFFRKKIIGRCATVLLVYGQFIDKKTCVNCR